MEEKLERLKEEAELTGLHININKMKGMRVNTSNMHKFRLGEAEIEEVESFVYLGSGKCGVREWRNREDVASRIKKANGVFFNCILCGKISTYQKKLKCEYLIQM